MKEKLFKCIGVMIMAMAMCDDQATVAKGLAGFKENPYLAQSYNNQTHWNSAASDSTDIGVARGWFEITPGSYSILPNDTTGISVMADMVNGTPVYWYWAGFSLVKFIVEGVKLVEIDRVSVPITLPDYQGVDAKDRMLQAWQVEKLLNAKDEQGLLDFMRRQSNRMLTAVEDQAAAGATYVVLTHDDTIITASSNKIYVFTQLDTKDPRSKMKLEKQVTLPENCFNNEKLKGSPLIANDAFIGMSMTYNGYLVLNTLGGNIISLDRDTLEVKDLYKISTPDEIFCNSFSTGPEAEGGAVYVASNQKMYRFVVDSKGLIHDDQESGAWSAPYERGSIVGAPKFADGTGSTPTLMGFGPHEDKLVVITDGSKKMNLVAFWRDAIPQKWVQKPNTLSPRIADQKTVDFGSGIDTVQSEQSVAIYGNYACVVNNIVADQKPFLAHENYYVATINGSSRPGPRGVAMFVWDNKNHAWQSKWKRNDVSSISIVPMISGQGRLAIVEGYLAPSWGDRYHIGLDIDSGETALLIKAGTNPLFNGMFSPLKIAYDGRIMYPMAYGLVLLDTTLMKKLR